MYISYARNSEEEQFVLSTLRSVLENELGYSVCIFDRDSLPGGSEYTPFSSSPAPAQVSTLQHPSFHPSISSSPHLSLQPLQMRL